jgi:ATP-dependent RNA helicase DeaD
VRAALPVGLQTPGGPTSPRAPFPPTRMAYKAVFDFTQKAQNEQKAAEPLKTPFAELDPDVPDATVETLPFRLQEGLEALGWPGLMPVQQQAIPYVLDARDLIVQSRTGSGKTGAFLLPMLERLDPDVQACQALVLCPTRELALQIFNEFERMNAGLPKDEQLRAVAVYGGTAYGPQLEAFEAGAHLVVGTPGRVLDHLSRGTLSLSRLEMLVLDEADEMLSMGFYPDMMKLKRYLPKVRDGYMFSATMPFQVQRIGQEFLNNPIFLATSGGTIHVDLMTHRAFAVDPRAKDRALATLIEWENPTSGIIFANTRREVEYLARFLTNYGLDAAGISSDLTQKAREEVMGRLRAGSLRFLVATDVAARGIDVEDLSHVFHYDVPQDPEYYVHRSGRTARAGKAGVSISLMTATDAPALRGIARRYSIPLEELPVPTEEELAARVSERLTALLEDDLRSRSRLERERQARFIPVVRQLVEEGEPEILAMLLDRVNQQSLHDARQATEALRGPGGFSGPVSPELYGSDADAPPPKKKRSGKGRSKAAEAPDALNGSAPDAPTPSDDA